MRSPCATGDPCKLRLDPGADQAADVSRHGGAKFTEPPLLVVEIRSPSTAFIDLNRKKAAYERFGVPSYWVVNPDPAQPELTVFELRDGRDALAAKASGPFTASYPFAVSIAPADLTRGLRH